MINGYTADKRWCFSDNQQGTREDYVS